MVEEAGSRIDTDGPSQREIKRAVCYAVGLAELELLSFDRFDNPLEPRSFRTAPHTLLRMALPCDTGNTGFARQSRAGMLVACQSWLPLALGKGRARDAAATRIILASLAE
jgi:hypothetical protein